MALQKILEVIQGLKLRILGQKPASNANTWGYHHIKIGTVNGDGGTSSGNTYVNNSQGARAVCIAAFDASGNSVLPSANVAASHTCTFVYIKSEDA